MTAFGMPVDPDVNRNLAIVSGPVSACAGVYAGIRLRARVREQRCGPVGRLVARDHDLDVARDHGLDRTAERRAIIGED